jgi:hypothetical protein
VQVCEGGKEISGKKSGKMNVVKSELCNRMRTMKETVELSEKIRKLI